MKAYEIDGWDSGIKIRRKAWKVSAKCYCVDGKWKYKDQSHKEQDMFDYIYAELILCTDWEVCQKEVNI